MKYHRILHRIRRGKSSPCRRSSEPTDDKSPPCDLRYLTMIDIEYDIRIEPLGHVDIALRPNKDYDARKTALWLNELLHRIYREVRRLILRGSSLISCLLCRSITTASKSTNACFKNGSPGPLKMVSVWTGWMISPRLHGKSIGLDIWPLMNPCQVPCSGSY